MTDQPTVDVEVLTPIRHGSPEPAQVGDVISIDARQAIELAEVGAVRIIDHADAPVQGEVRLFPGDGEPKPLSVFYYTMAGVLQHLGDFPTWDDAAAAFAPISADMDAEAKSFSDRLLAAEQLAAERGAEIERLSAALSAGAELPSTETVAGTDASNPVEGPVTPEPKPVSVTMGRDELREIAREEGIAFDANDTKAELVAKISAGRLTARGAA